MDYEEAIDYLVGLTKFGFNFGLGRIEYLMELLGNPHHALRVIHIGGTNGKGSTAMMAARVLEDAGYRTGLFTSPHLHSYTERYLINGIPITEERFASLLTRLRPLLEQMVREGREHPTEFEVCTALAFLYFYEAKVDFLVLEVGLGGVIDSTNIVPTPLVAVITNISFDHMDYLGNSIREIAAVKAGIIKQGGQVVTAAAEPDALEVITARCRDAGASLLCVGKEITWKLEEVAPRRTGFTLKSPWGSYLGLAVPLAGQYQAVNAATALGVLEVLNRVHGFEIAPEHIRTGFAKSTWPARLELMATKPAVLIDVSHNYDGACNLKAALQDIYDYQRLVLVMGMLGDKEREKVVGELAPLADTVIIARPLSPRAGDWEMLAKQARRYVERVFLIEEITEAVDAAVEEAGPADLICVTGSFYMVSDARAYLLKRYCMNVA